MFNNIKWTEYQKQGANSIVYKHNNLLLKTNLKNKNREIKMIKQLSKHNLDFFPQYYYLDTENIIMSYIE